MVDGAFYLSNKRERDKRGGHEIIFPNYKERFAWGAVVLGDDKFYIASMKNRVHVGFAITGLSKNEIRLFEGSGKTMRHIKIHSTDDIDENKLAELIKMVDKKTTCIQH